jgi:hypothetical protein
MMRGNAVAPKQALDAGLVFGSHAVQAVAQSDVLLAHAHWDRKLEDEKQAAESEP